ncbi:hypothetical protein, partial [Sagittula marina]|uniref:hypothetical protein n=1 Tax=Sagittula marina TaxID=943940 RepID=UPI001C865097
MTKGTREKMRRCIKEPIPEIFAAWDVMREAVDAHVHGDFARADDLFQQADSPKVWDWLNSAWVVTCHGIFPPPSVRVRSNLRTDNEANAIYGRTDHPLPGRRIR